MCPALLPPRSDRYLAIPYKRHGRSSTGCDCWGLVCLVYLEEYGINLPAYNDVLPGDPSIVATAARKEIRSGGWISVLSGGAMPGDVVWLWVRRRETPSHVGVVVERGSFLGIRPAVGVRIERYDQGFWRGRLAGLYRHDPSDPAV